jgi:hypothetical protein
VNAGSMDATRRLQTALSRSENELRLAGERARVALAGALADPAGTQWAAVAQHAAEASRAAGLVRAYTEAADLTAGGV